MRLHVVSVSMRSASVCLLVTACCLITYICSTGDGNNLSREVISDEECGSNLSIYGPGWDQPELILPSRYFIINIPNHCDKEAYQVDIIPPRGQKDCLFKQQTLRQTLLSIVIVRYRLLSLSCTSGFTITISNKTTGQALAIKEVTSAIKSEDCMCPSPDFSEQMGCSTDLKWSRIEDDLRYV